MVRSVAGDLPEQVKNNQSVNLAAGNGGQKMSQYSWFTVYIIYKMIQEYVEKKYGFKVHTAYIAEVKRSLGLSMYDAPNAAGELKQPRKHPPKEKAEAIMEALKHFEVI